MANRRMFSRDITDSDAFVDMPPSSQALYFHLGMNADDDGFVGSPKRIMRCVGASEDDLRILVAKRFLLVFESGVVVVKHWRINNLIKSDRYHATKYQDEMATLAIKENKSYTEANKRPELALLQSGTELEPGRNHDGAQMEPQYRLGKDRLEEKKNIKKKRRSDGDELEPGETQQRRSRFSKPTQGEVASYAESKGYSGFDAESFIDHYEANGWKVGKNPMKDWKAAVRNWARNSYSKQKGVALREGFAKYN